MRFKDIGKKFVSLMAVVASLTVFPQVCLGGFFENRTLSKEESNALRDQGACIQGRLRLADFAQLLPPAIAQQMGIPQEGYSIGFGAVVEFLNQRVVQEKFDAISAHFLRNYSSNIDAIDAVLAQLGIGGAVPATAVPIEPVAQEPDPAFCPWLTAPFEVPKFESVEQEEGAHVAVFHFSYDKDDTVKQGLAAARLALGIGNALDHLLLATPGVKFSPNLVTLANATGYRRLMGLLKEHLNIYMEQTKEVPVAQVFTLAFNLGYLENGLEDPKDVAPFVRFMEGLVQRTMLNSGAYDCLTQGAAPGDEAKVYVEKFMKTVDDMVFHLISGAHHVQKFKDEKAAFPAFCEIAQEVVKISQRAERALLSACPHLSEEINAYKAAKGEYGLVAWVERGLASENHQGLREILAEFSATWLRRYSLPLALGS